MGLPSEYQELAKRFGVTKPPTQSDQDFMRWLDSLRRHVKLVREAKEWGVSLQFGMTSKEVRLALHRRLLQLLKERGFNKDATVELRGRVVKITEIMVQEGSNPTITVKYWISHPWEKRDNRGRANHVDAKTMLLKGKLTS